MRFTADQDALTAATAWASTPIQAKTVQPVLAMLQIEAADGRLRLTGTDYQTTAHATCEAVTDLNGTVYAPGRFFAEIIKSLPKGRPVSAELDGSLLNVRCGPARFAMPVLPAGEGFGVMPVMPATVGTAVGAEFAEAAAIAARITSRDTSLPVLAGIYTVFGPDSILLVATDRYRLVNVRLPVVRDDDRQLEPVLIPGTAMDRFAKAADGAGKITLAYDGTDMVGFGDGTREVTTRTIGGQFPKWESRFPAETAYAAVVNADLVIGAARRCALAADTKGDPVLLTFHGDEVTVEATGHDGSSGTETVPGVVFDGPDGTARLFKAEYLIDGLAGTRSDLARIAMQSSAVKPVVITAAPADPEADPDPDPAYRYVTVPLRKATE